MPKYYTVWKGKKKGVFNSWDECKASVQGFSGAKYKSFGSRARAEAEFRNETLLPPREVSADGEKGFDDTAMALAVDGACSGTTGEYRGVLLPSKAEVFKGGPWEHCTNNMMEYLAAVRGLKWISNRGLRVPVYTDSRTALKWLKDDPECACRTTRPPPPDSAVAGELKRSRGWLRTRADKARLVACLQKWDTEALGEIPADFNRK
jgi:ribonuclease HI